MRRVFDKIVEVDLTIARKEDFDREVIMHAFLVCLVLHYFNFEPEPLNGMIVVYDHTQTYRSVVQAGAISAPLYHTYRYTQRESDTTRACLAPEPRRKRERHHCTRIQYRQEYGATCT